MEDKMYQNVADSDVLDVVELKIELLGDLRDPSYAPNRFMELKPLRRVWDEFQFIFSEWPDNLAS